MNSERLLALFERISEAPDAIPRLRRFILDLAVRGKLVEQDPEDDPAGELLKQIALQRKILIADGQLRKERNEPTIPEPTPYGLPPGWRWIPFGMMHWLTRGVTYTKSDVSEIPEDGYIPLLRANNIGEKLSLEDPVYVRSGCVGDEQYLRSGDFLIALSSGSKHLVGKAVLIPEISAFAFGGFCGVIRIFDEECTGFTKVFLKSSLYRDSVASGSRGIGINNLKKEVLANAFFPLPPLAEQHRIVAKVEELMALCDQLTAARMQREQCRERLVAASLQRLNQPSDEPDAFRSDARFALQVLPSLTTSPAQIKQLRQTILNLAVRGKLVEQGPEDEPAEVWLHKLRSLPTGSIDGIGRPPFDLPSGWHWLGFSNLFDVAGGIQKTPNRAPRSNPFPYLGVSNVYRGRLDLSVVKLFELEPGELDRRKLEVGDLLIIEGNGSLKEIGRCAKWGGEIENCVHQNHVIRCRPCSTEISDFAILFLNSPWGMEIMQRLAITSSGLYSLSVGKIRKIEIPLPPLAEQHRIVAKVDALMALCDQLEQQLSQGEESRQRLLEAVLQEALAGRLPERP